METRLGTVRCPSGQLVIIDMGYLDAWCGAGDPSPDFGTFSEETYETMRSAVDLRIVGPDAEAAAAAFGRQSLTYLYDIPAFGIDQIRESFAGIVDPLGLDARVEEEGRRISHRERVDRAVAGGGAELILYGISAVGVGVPADRELEVIATDRDWGPRVGRRWERLSIVVDGREAVSSRLVGWVGVDWARLLLGDPALLDAWEHHQSLDGRGDFLFWGRDAEALAVAFDAPALDDHQFGWLDRPIDELLERGVAIEEAVGRGEYLAATDFRPHSHHFQVMAQVRGSEHETGTIELAGSRAVALMTSWGDGLYPVHVEHDGDGHTAAIHVVLGDDDRCARLEQLFAR